MSASRIYVEVAEGGVVCLLPKLALASPLFWKGRMFALGQKQTCAAQKVMSALLPKAFEIADIAFPKKGRASCRRCRLLRSQSEEKRKFFLALQMSASDPKRTSTTAAALQQRDVNYFACTNASGRLISISTNAIGCSEPFITSCSTPAGR